MAEYLANAEQAVSLNAPVVFTASIPCQRGYVYHDDETGIFILRGVTNNCFARYRVTFNGNIAIPEGGTVTLRRIADKAEDMYRLIVKDRGLTVWSISVYETEEAAVNAMNEMMKG